MYPFCQIEGIPVNLPYKLKGEEEENWTARQQTGEVTRRRALTKVPRKNVSKTGEGQNMPWVSPGSFWWDPSNVLPCTSMYFHVLHVLPLHLILSIYFCPASDGKLQLWQCFAWLAAARFWARTWHCHYMHHMHHMHHMPQRNEGLHDHSQLPGRRAQNIYTENYWDIPRSYLPWRLASLSLVKDLLGPDIFLQSFCDQKTAELPCNTKTAIRLQVPGRSAKMTKFAGISLLTTIRLQRQPVKFRPLQTYIVEDSKIVHVYDSSLCGQFWSKGVAICLMFEWHSSESMWIRGPEGPIPSYLHPEVRARATLTKLMQSHVLSTGPFAPSVSKWVAMWMYEYGTDSAACKVSGQASAATFSGTSVEHLWEQKSWKNWPTWCHLMPFESLKTASLSCNATQWVYWSRGSTWALHDVVPHSSEFSWVSECAKIIQSGCLRSPLLHRCTSLFVKTAVTERPTTLHASAAESEASGSTAQFAISPGSSFCRAVGCPKIFQGDKVSPSSKSLSSSVSTCYVYLVLVAIKHGNPRVLSGLITGLYLNAYIVLFSGVV